MLKFLTIFFIVSYLVYKVGGYLMRGIFMSMGQNQHPPPFNKKSRKAPDSNLNIDYVPKNQQGQKKDYEGGEYVDYEEVK